MWLLITIRLSINNLAGIERTLVAVGTWSEASMLVTTRAAVPRSGSTCPDEGDSTTGAPFWIACAGSGVVVRGALDITDCGCADCGCTVGVESAFTGAAGVAALVDVGVDADAADAVDVDAVDAEAVACVDAAAVAAPLGEELLALFGAGGRPPLAGRVNPGGSCAGCAG